MKLTREQMEEKGDNFCCICGAPFIIINHENQPENLCMLFFLMKLERKENSNTNHLLSQKIGWCSRRTFQLLLISNLNGESLSYRGGACRRAPLGFCSASSPLSVVDCGVLGKSHFGVVLSCSRFRSCSFWRFVVGSFTEACRRVSLPVVLIHRWGGCLSKEPWKFSESSHPSFRWRWGRHMKVLLVCSPRGLLR